MIDFLQLIFLNQVTNNNFVFQREDCTHQNSSFGNLSNQHSQDFEQNHKTSFLVYHTDIDSPVYFDTRDIRFEYNLQHGDTLHSTEQTSQLIKTVEVDKFKGNLSVRFTFKHLDDSEEFPESQVPERLKMHMSMTGQMNLVHESSDSVVLSINVYPKSVVMDSLSIVCLRFNIGFNMDVDIDTFIDDVR